MKPFDSPLRWLVPSKSKPGESHLVQLDAYGVNGCCTCPDFQCRHEPILRRDPTLGGVDKTRCKHIRKVRAVFLDRIIAEMSKATKALVLLACASLGAAPSEGFLDALAWAESKNQPKTIADGGEALGAYGFHRAAWIDADSLRAKQDLPRAKYEVGAFCPVMSRAYASTLLADYQRRLKARGLEPTPARLWLCWTMGFNGARQIGFNINAAPAYKRRGYQRLVGWGHLANNQR